MSGLPRDILKWLQSLDLSYSLKNIRRDFANGFLIAEIFSRYYKSEIAMHSFENGIGLQKRLENWEILIRFFQKMNFPIERQLIDAVIHCKKDAAIPLLEQIYTLLTHKTVQSVRPLSDTELAPSFARPTAAKIIKQRMSESDVSPSPQSWGAYKDEKLVKHAAESVLQQYKEKTKQEKLSLTQQNRLGSPFKATFGRMNTGVSTAPGQTSSASLKRGGAASASGSSSHAVENTFKEISVRQGTGLSMSNASGINVFQNAALNEATNEFNQLSIHQSSSSSVSSSSHNTGFPASNFPSSSHGSVSNNTSSVPTAATTTFLALFSSQLSTALNNLPSVRKGGIALLEEFDPRRDVVREFIDALALNGSSSGSSFCTVLEYLTEKELTNLFHQLNQPAFVQACANLCMNNPKEAYVAFSTFFSLLYNLLLLANKQAEILAHSKYITSGKLYDLFTSSTTSSPTFGTYFLSTLHIYLDLFINIFMSMTAADEFIAYNYLSDFIWPKIHNYLTTLLASKAHHFHALPNYLIFNLLARIYVSFFPNQATAQTGTNNQTNNHAGSSSSNSSPAITFLLDKFDRKDERQYVTYMRFIAQLAKVDHAINDVDIIMGVSPYITLYDAAISSPSVSVQASGLSLLSALLSSSPALQNSDALASGGGEGEGGDVKVQAEELWFFVHKIEKTLPLLSPTAEEEQLLGTWAIRVELIHAVVQLLTTPIVSQAAAANNNNNNSAQQPPQQQSQGDIHTISEIATSCIALLDDKLLSASSSSTTSSSSSSSASSADNGHAISLEALVGGLIHLSTALSSYPSLRRTFLGRLEESPTALFKLCGTLSSNNLTLAPATASAASAAAVNVIDSSLDLFQSHFPLFSLYLDPLLLCHVVLDNIYVSGCDNLSLTHVLLLYRALVPEVSHNINSAAEIVNTINDSEVQEYVTLFLSLRDYLTVELCDLELAPYIIEILSIFLKDARFNAATLTLFTSNDAAATNGGAGAGASAPPPIYSIMCFLYPEGEDGCRVLFESFMSSLLHAEHPNYLAFQAAVFHNLSQFKSNQMKQAPGSGSQQAYQGLTELLFQFQNAQLLQQQQAQAQAHAHAQQIR